MAETAGRARDGGDDRPRITVACPQCDHHFAVPGIRLDGRELSRRAKLLLQGLRRGKFGRPVCPFCQKPKSSDFSLLNHLRRMHAEELMQPPVGDVTK